jgi:cell shape-determining protein MreD
MLQSGIASRITLFSGATDLILLFLAAWGLQSQIKNIWLWTLLAGMILSFMSAMPFFAPIFGYLALTSITQILKKRVWETPILAMLLAVFFGTLIQHIIYFFALIISGTPISWIESINLVTLPSLLINMLLAIPMYAAVHEIAMIIKPVGAIQ